MAKAKSTGKVATQLAAPAKAKTDLWTVAITDAERMIEQLRKQISQLKQSIQAFQGLRESGAPFPGAEEAIRRVGSESQT